MSDQQQIIEHVVLFKVKPDVDSTKLTAMVNGLYSLTSLNLTVHLSAGKLLRSQSPSLNFTHILHSRYRSKSDLHNYAVHPEHIRVVNDNKPIIDDIMAVDWISNGVIGSPKPGSAMRVSFLKLKENVNQNEKSRVLEVIGRIKNRFQIIEQLSFGENFSYDRAKGYTIALMVVLPENTDFEVLDLNVDEVQDSIESVLVVDYMVPFANMLFQRVVFYLMVD